MRAYVRVTIDIPVDVPDKYEVLSGWTPKVTGEEAATLQDDLWEDAVVALQEKLTSSGIYDDNFFVKDIVDEWGFIIVKGD